MAAAEEPRDFVMATGESHTVRDVCEIAFGHVDLDWRAHVKVDDTLKRAPEPVPRVGNAARARRELGWEPRVGFQQLVVSLVDADRAALSEPVLA
jgi:GDPmannose 4,6-dehydratase